MLQLFSRAKDEVVTADEFLKYANKNRSVIPSNAEDPTHPSEPQRDSSTTSQNDDTEKAEIEGKEKLIELAHAYKKYQELLISENSMDFGDLILWTIQLFKTRPSVLKKYQKQFEHILVDEFQDTNYAQYELLKLLAPVKNNPNLVVVGDDDQSIYRFRSASVSNILGFKKDYPKAQTVVLTKNYRSTQIILDSAYHLIQNNNPDRLEEKLKIDKKLESIRKKQKETEEIDPETITADRSEGEADEVAKRINKLTQTGNYSHKDIAILARANNHLDPFAAVLKRTEIPYSLVGNRGLYDQEEIRQLISFLKLIASQTDNVSLYNLLLCPVFDLKPEDVTEILQTSRLQKVNLWECLKKYSSGNNQKSIERGTKRIITVISNALALVHKRSVGQILYDFIIDTGFVENLLKEETVKNHLKIKNINLFFNQIKKFEGEAENPTVFEFVDYLEMLLEAGENPAQAEIEDIDTVKLLTVHSSKGLEFPVVFIVSLVSDRFPTRERSEPLPLPDDLVKEILPEGNAHLEEERRLFYVGVTRARDLLFLSWAKNYGGVREKKESGFIKELNLHVNVAKKKEEIGQLSLLGFNMITESETVKPPKKTNGNPLKYVSYSQIETFNTCPLKYYYRYILGLTGAPSHALNFGQTIHRTLRDFHRADFVNKEKTLDDLLKLYEHHFIGEGYETIEHKKKRYEEGREILHQYFIKSKDLLNQPVHLERKFTIRINDIFLIGSIDRIDQREDKTYEIIDYKTGEGKNKQKDIDKDAQLSIYAIAAKEAVGITPDLLSLYFIERNVKASTKRTDEELRAKKEEIIRTMGDIQKSDFPGKFGPWCEWCEFKRICPVYKVGNNNY
jgi:DNA helicase-2/ATP-dependent DNA helicase PcrA